MKLSSSKFVILSLAIMTILIAFGMIKLFFPQPGHMIIDYERGICSTIQYNVVVDSSFQSGAPKRLSIHNKGEWAISGIYFVSNLDSSVSYVLNFGRNLPKDDNVTFDLSNLKDYPIATQSSYTVYPFIDLNKKEYPYLDQVVCKEIASILETQ